MCFAIENGSALRGFQFDLNYDPHFISLSSPFLSKQQENTIISTNILSDGVQRFIIADMVGDFIKAEGIHFVSIPFEFYGSKFDVSGISAENVNLVSSNGSFVDHVVRVNSIDIGLTPDKYSLLQNFPNPFNPTTEIVFSLPTDSFVELSVFNMAGQKVRSLSSDNLKAGYHSIIWNGMDDSGLSVASGMYFYTIHVGSYKNTKKMLFLK